MKIYTMQDWSRDRVFKAEPYQEITEDIYNEFYNVLPPLGLPWTIAEKATKAITGQDNIFCCGFLCGSAYDCDKKGTLYSAFIKIDNKYYYAGLSHIKEVEE